MMTFQKILCPIDFSAGSRQAMRAAVRLADAAGAELVLAHAWYVPPLAFGGEYELAAALTEEIRADAQGSLDAAAREAAELGARRVSPRLLAGNPAHELVRALEDDPALDLVVMGTHGRTGLARVLLGSIAESVIRRAPCPVLVVRPDGAVGPFARVLCPVDFSEASERALDLAAGLAQPGGAGITLLHVIEPPAIHARVQRLLEVVRDLDKWAAAHLDAWAARAPAPAAKLCRVGHAGAEILKVLDEGPAFDLVVLGSHGKLGLERVLLGSVAEKVVRHASCPVLVARRRPAPADAAPAPLV
jgi:nucleotide-binding universal stress UspA family protein